MGFILMETVYLSNVMVMLSAQSNMNIELYNSCIMCFYNS